MQFMRKFNELFIYCLQLLNCIASQCIDVGTPRLLQEILIGGGYAAARKNLPADAATLLPLLPLTVVTPAIRQEMKVRIIALHLVADPMYMKQ